MSEPASTCDKLTLRFGVGTAHCVKFGGTFALHTHTKDLQGRRQRGRSHLISRLVVVLPRHRQTDSLTADWWLCSAQSRSQILRESSTFGTVQKQFCKTVGRATKDVVLRQCTGNVGGGSSRSIVLCVLPDVLMDLDPWTSNVPG